MSDIVFDDMIEDGPEQTPTLHQAMSAPEIYHYKEGNGLRFLVPLDDYEKLIEENAAMREVIREAHGIITTVEALWPVWCGTPNQMIEHDKQKAVLTKLQPLLKT